MCDFHQKKIILMILVGVNFQNLTANTKNDNIVKFPDDIENVHSPEFIVKKLEEKKFQPVALLIEDVPESFILADFFVDNLASDNLNFWILTFNATGVSTLLVPNSINAGEIETTLKNLTSNSYLNEDNTLNRSLPFFATLHAAQILPKNATIVVFSQQKIVDENLAQLAFNAIITKNITVHLYWDDPASSPNHYLTEISKLSGGQIFGLKQSSSLFEKFKVDDKHSKLNMLLTRKNQKQTNTFHFLIDSDVIGIYLSVVPWDDSTVLLSSPLGFSMTFSDDDRKDAAKKYSFGSFSEHQDDSLEINLNFLNSARPTVGTWSLKIDNFRRSYNVTVYGLTNITTQAFIKEKYKENTFSQNKEIINIGVTGEINKISDVTFVKSDGYSIIENVTYTNSKEKLAVRKNDEVSKVFDVEVGNTSNLKPAYALVRGLDSKGNTFERITSIFGFNRNQYPPQQSLSVEVGVGSQLLIVPGEQAQIYFEVSNRGNDVVNVFFLASDTRWILQSLSAYRRVLNPQETYIVTLTLTHQSRSGTYQDEITFTAKTGGQLVQKKVIIDVGATQNYYDRSEPYLDHTYTSDCTEVIFKRCERGTWTIEVTAQDTDSGILQVNSVPKGLYFPNSYTAGTLDRVVGYYSDSCCNPDLQIIAIDRANNRRSYYVNAYHAIWSPGAIAALILGILLFILLIALIVFLICRCRKKKETYDLPTYRGGNI